MRKKHFKAMTTAAAFTAIILTGAISALAGEADEKPQMEHPDMGQPAMMEQDTTAMHEEMHAKMQAMDSKLADLVAAMNAATGDGKTDAVAAVVTELVAQRKAMHEMMMKMQPQMKCRMMAHMKPGKMADCPMMKGMSPPADADSDPEHSEHHPEG